MYKITMIEVVDLTKFNYWLKEILSKPKSIGSNASINKDCFGMSSVNMILLTIVYNIMVN